MSRLAAEAGLDVVMGWRPFARGGQAREAWTHGEVPARPGAGIIPPRGAADGAVPPRAKPPSSPLGASRLHVRKRPASQVFRFERRLRRGNPILGRGSE